MKFVTLMDDHPSEHLGLIHEHGLSMYFDLGNLKGLFDFGATAHTLDNARKLNVPLSALRVMIASHGHYDHAGGYPYFVEAGVTAPLVTGKGFFAEKYAREEVAATYLGCGFDEAFLRQHQVEHRVCEAVLPLTETAWVVSHFERRYEFETIPERFQLHTERGWQADRFQDELCMVCQEPEGLTVVVGCSHPGILNMLSTVQSHFSQPIRRILGGAHLVEASPERIRRTLQIMQEMGVQQLGLNHCSGTAWKTIAADFPALQVFLPVVGNVLL